VSEPIDLPACALCEEEVRENQPCTFVLAQTRVGLVKLPAHLACFGKMVAGEVARELRGVLAGRAPGGVVYEGDSLDGTLAHIVERLVNKYT
jgi:hypothetical protein